MREPRPAAALTQWRKASFCAAGECVEISKHGDMIAVRDSKNPETGILRYSRDEWRAFVLGVKAGEFDDLA